jgi:hypothetical protein
VAVASSSAIRFRRRQGTPLRINFPVANEYLEAHVKIHTALLLIPVYLACSDDAGSLGLDPGEPTFSYEGYVRSAGDSTPIEGVTVALYEEDGGEFRFRGGSQETDAAGFYSNEIFHCPVSLGRAYLIAQCNGLCVGWADSEPRFITSCSPSTQQYDFALVPAP